LQAVDAVFQHGLELCLGHGGLGENGRENQQKKADQFLHVAVLVRSQGENDTAISA